MISAALPDSVPILGVGKGHDGSLIENTGLEKDLRNQVKATPKASGELQGRDEYNTIVPARRMAELVACSIQLGHPLSWSCCRSSSAIHRAGLVQLGGWPRWSRGQSSSATRRAGRCALSTLQ
ncbi:hypothetical protein F2Q70_00004949 [Brassica cretica]|uniref:Uncharacterized protein n=1 Tax=Brassica cretica TaxID=69181 RepID=A0A8S9IW86_BRACR|nr:hypothetical protein F2Q70_00004949 [Brassica cretica]